MVKKILKFLILFLTLVGIFLGVRISINKTNKDLDQKEIEQAIFGSFQTKTAEITKFYTYGKSLCVEGSISGIDSDNFESIRLVISDGQDYEKQYKMSTELNDTTLEFSPEEINNCIILDDLENGTYYVYIRVKLNNSIDARYYTLENISEYEDIEYYTVTKNNENRKATISFGTQNYDNSDYTYLGISLENTEIPDDIYDIVIDAGHGGTDVGEKSGSDNEAAIALEYAKILKQDLEEMGYKVKLTRDDDNTSLYNSTNMYDSARKNYSSLQIKSKAYDIFSYK